MAYQYKLAIDPETGRLRGAPPHENMAPPAVPRGGIRLWWRRGLGLVRTDPAAPAAEHFA
jgi:hypothetical protein